MFAVVRGDRLSLMARKLPPGTTSSRCAMNCDSFMAFNCCDVATEYSRCLSCRIVSTAATSLADVPLPTNRRTGRTSLLVGGTQVVTPSEMNNKNEGSALLAATVETRLRLCSWCCVYYQLDRDEGHPSKPHGVPECQRERSVPHDGSSGKAPRMACDNLRDPSDRARDAAGPETFKIPCGDWRISVSVRVGPGIEQTRARARARATARALTCTWLEAHAHASASSPLRWSAANV